MEKKNRNEKENRRDTQAPAAGAEAGSEPGRAAAEPAAVRVQAPFGSDDTLEVEPVVGSAKAEELRKPDGVAAGGASVAPGLARAADRAARAGRRKAQPVSGDDLGDEFAIEVEEDDGGAGKGRKKKKQRALDAPQAAGEEAQPIRRKAGKLVNF